MIHDVLLFHEVPLCVQTQQKSYQWRVYGPIVVPHDMSAELPESRVVIPFIISSLRSELRRLLSRFFFYFFEIFTESLYYSIKYMG